MGHNSVVLGHPKSIEFRRLTGCQRDPRIWGVTLIHLKSFYFLLKGKIGCKFFLK